MTEEPATYFTDIEPSTTGPMRATGDPGDPAIRNIDQMQQTVGEWSVSTFPGSSPVTVTKHLLEEARELKFAAAAQPGQVAEEAADCFLLLLGLAHRMGFSLFDAALAKHATNVKREWAPDAKGYHKHVEVPL